LNSSARNGAAGNIADERHAVGHQALLAVARDVHGSTKQRERGASAAVQIDRLHASEVQHDLCQFRERHADRKIASSVNDHEPKIAGSGSANRRARMPLVRKLGAKAFCGRGDVGGSRLHQRWAAADNVVDRFPVEAGRLPL